MNFFEKTFLDWKVTLDPIAARNPNQLNVASLADASATPPTIGTSDPTTASVGASPRKSADSSTEKNGSIALMVCVKDTATAPRDTLVSRLPSVCTAASGSTALTSALSTLGAGCSLKIHMRPASALPTANCSVVQESEYGNTWSTCLLKMLNQMLKAYQAAKSAPRRAVLAKLDEEGEEASGDGFERVSFGREGEI